MKTTAEIKEEIDFQKSEYDRINAMLACEKFKLSKGNLFEGYVTSYRQVMSRHAARIQVLEWVIGDEK
jgi:hypothetical protein